MIFASQSTQYPVGECVGEMKNEMGGIFWMMHVSVFSVIILICFLFHLFTYFLCLYRFAITYHFLSPCIITFISIRILMSEEKKTIKINPEMFKFPEKTRKKKKTSVPSSSTTSTTSPSKIKMKPMTNLHSRTLKRNVMKMIRAKQQDEYKNLFSEKKNESSTTSTSTSTSNTGTSNEFSAEFNKTLEYFENLAKTKENQQQQQHHQQQQYHATANTHNHTLKHPPQPHITSANHTLPPVNLELSSEFHTSSPVYIRPSPPTYGCLKNGSLPTFRNLHNTTVKNAVSSAPSSFSNIPIVKDVTPQMQQMPQMPQLQQMQQLQQMPQLQQLQSTQQIQRSFLEKASEKMKLLQYKKSKLRNLKRKKIYRRTFRVGKSKIRPKIGVLISNKTIRQKIQQTCHEFKHADIKDIRKTLLKNGLIKVGTNAPNDVLRKMYETVMSVCGEIQNHNPDTLLFNFMNDKDD